MGHVHAELMAQYAEDARETARPWERWEQKGERAHWNAMTGSPLWLTGTQYRRKPRTTTIKGREVPEPMREEPRNGTAVHVALVGVEQNHYRTTWAGFVLDKMWLSRGLCHSTKEAAIAHAEALLSFTEVE